MGVLIMLTLYRVSEEIDKYSANFFDIRNELNVVIIHDSVVRDFIKTNYSCFYMSKTLDTCFTDYINTTKNDFLKMYDAWITAYEPLENYNRTESTSHTKNIGNEKTTNSGDITTDGTSENDSNNIPTSKHFTTTYDSASENRLESYEESTGRTSTNTTTTQDTSTETEYKTTSLNNLTAHEVEINSIHAYGNIGVTTSQQMLQSEIDLRKQYLTRMYLDMFCKKYMFYVGGDDIVVSNILY